MVFESSTVFPDPENPEDSESFAGILDNKKLLGALSLFPPVMGQDSCYLGYTDTDTVSQTFQQQSDYLPIFG